MTAQGEAALYLAQLATRADDEATQTLARLLYYQTERAAQTDPQIGADATTDVYPATGETARLDTVDIWAGL